MPISDQLQSTLQQVSDQVPMWFDVLLGFAGLWGLFLLLFGRRILRPSLAMTGLIAGSIAAGILGRQFVSGNEVVIFVIVGGVVGVLIGWLTYRLWMAVLLALMLALAVPWGVLAWYGAPPSPIEQRLQTMRDPNLGRDIIDAEAIGDSFAAEPPDDPANERIIDRSADADPNNGVIDRAARAGRNLWNELTEWWTQQVSPSVRWSAMTAAVIVAIGGFVVGLVMPELAASLATSLVGAVFVLGSVMRLSGRYMPAVDEWLPDGPRGVLLVAAALTLVGTLLQWTVLRRRSSD